MAVLLSAYLQLHELFTFSFRNNRFIFQNVSDTIIFPSESTTKFPTILIACKHARQQEKQAR